MKTPLSIFVFMIVSICASAQNDQKNNPESNGASFNWTSSTTHELGEVKKGNSVSSTFEFTNIGNEPLIITEATGSCGCTSVEYSQQPIKPGEKGFVKATFNSAAVGVFQKSITVTSNTASKTVQLYIKGQVVN